MNNKELKFIIAQGEGQFIAFLLSRTIYVEKMGTGIKRIKDSIRDADLPEPKFRFDEHNFFVEIDDSIDQKYPENVPENVPEQINKTQVEIIRIIGSDKSVSREYIAKELGLSLEAIKKNIKQLKKKGRIKRIGPDKGGYWELIIK